MIHRLFNPTPRPPGRGVVVSWPSIIRSVHRFAVVVTLCIALAVGGCMVKTSPQTVMGFPPSESSHRMRTISKTDYSGEYALYEVSTGTRDRRKTLVRAIRLGKNEPIGFRTASGQVSAVAGRSEIPLGPGSYQWELKADPGQIDWPHTTVLVLVIAVVVILCIVTGVAVYAAATLP